MPYYKDPYFSEFLKDNWRIWRYVNFDKFVDLLIKKQQYFVSGSKLMKIDPYEGHFQKSAVIFGKFTDHELAVVDAIHQKINKQPRNLFVNCWHINTDQSDAMWKIYAKGNGIAIQTTIKKLKDSFHDFNQKVIIAKVRYVDDFEDIRKRTDLLYRFSAKRKNFKHEKEIRIFVEGKYNDIFDLVDGRILGHRKIPMNERIRIESDKDGRYVPVNLCDFIEKVYVSPFSTRWFEKLVKSIAIKYGLSKNVIKRSELYDKPKSNRWTLSTMPDTE